MEATGSITIKRLRKGRNIVLGFTTDNSLFQGWNPISKKPDPDFTKAENQPTVTPNVYSSDGSTCTIGAESKWYYNSMDTPIEWNTASGGYRTSKNGLFKENTTTHAITFIKDIASETNKGSDTFYFVAVGEVAGVNYTATGSFEFKIQEISSSGYTLMTSGGNALTATATEVTLKAHLFVDGKADTSKVIKWYQSDMKTLIPTEDNSYTVKVSTNHVSGQGPDAGVYCMAFEKAGDTVALATTFHQINDFTDDYDVELYVSANPEWDGTNAATVNARLRNVRTQEVVSTGVTWSSNIYDSKVKDPIASNVAGMPLTVGNDYWSEVGDDSDLVITTAATWA